jgi:hypothetical protein
LIGINIFFTIASISLFLSDLQLSQS